MIPSPYQADLDRLQDERSYFDLYDDLPASAAWMQTIGAALGNAFGIKVAPSAEEWEIDYAKKELRCGSIEQIYTRRGVLGLLLNGIGRLALGIAFPSTTKEAHGFAKKHAVPEGVAKHFGALARIVDELRTDDAMAHNYAGGERVVSTMHSQAYEGAQEQLRMMAIDMRARREMARMVIEWFEHLMSLVDRTILLGEQDVASKTLMALQSDVNAHFVHLGKKELTLAMGVAIWDSVWMNNEVRPNIIVDNNTGRIFAAMLIALHPQDADTILKVLARGYSRNIAIFGPHLTYEMVKASDEKEIIQVAGNIFHDFEELKALGSHSGGHAQYVLAKAEQYYHGTTLGIPMATPYLGYDMEAKILDVEAANKSARELAQAIIDHGFTTNVGESITFAKELLPLVEKYPFLDLNDRKKQEGGNMAQRVAGAGAGGPPQPKRSKEREDRSKEDRTKDRRKMEGMDNQKNQEEVDKARAGYSILDKGNIDPLKRYLYLIGPYLGRISATAAKMRRVLKVNDPLGLRGAYRRGKALNPKVLYKHRLDDFKLFSQREVDKNINYGFALMGDLSGSTEMTYSKKSNRQVEDEILASAFLITEVAERIGEKMMCAVGFFDNGAKTIKRTGFYLNRAEIITKIKEHGGGTNVSAAGSVIAEDLAEMEEFKVKNKTIVFITDGGFSASEFLTTVKAAKKFNASIAYFSLCENASQGAGMAKEIERFVQANAKGIRVRTKNIPLSAVNMLPEAIAQLMKETITARV